MTSFLKTPFIKNLLNTPSTISKSLRSPSTTRDNFLQLVGLATAGWFAFKFARFLYQGLSARFFPHNLIKRYGKHSWAVVTGASDGIGKGFCEELTRMGFNIILIARNKVKLENVVHELRKIRPDVETKVIVADFTNSAKEKFLEEIITDIEDFDVSLLINNVGLETMEEFENIKPEFLRDMEIVNTLPMVILSKALIQKMKTRKHKSGIINLSSMSGVRPVPFFTTYSATKRFAHIFSLALAQECRNWGIDVLSAQPGYITTNMTAQKAVSWDTTSVNIGVKGFLNNLGQRDHTYGHLKHKLKVIFQVNLLPDFIFTRIVKKLLVGEMQRRRDWHSNIQLSKA